MNADDRHRQIVGLIRTRGYISNEELARLFEVTVQTIRRDVNQLAASGRITRHHGGAGLANGIENIAYTERQALNRTEKHAIAQQASAAIPDSSSLFISIGTTTEAFARALRGHSGLQVITNNLQVAGLLWPQPGFRVAVAGGTVRSHDGGMVGQSACDQINCFRADFGVIGISGIDEDGSLLDFDMEEIRVARAIMKNARQVFLLADHTKFGRRPLMRLGSITEVHALFTDRSPPAGVTRLLSEHQIPCHVGNLIA